MAQESVAGRDEQNGDMQDVHKTVDKKAVFKKAVFKKTVFK